jgi:hypothetical protein
VGDKKVVGVLVNFRAPSINEHITNMIAKANLIPKHQLLLEKMGRIVNWLEKTHCNTNC